MKKRILTPPSENPHRSQAHDTYLRANARKLSLEEMATHLGWSRYSVTKRLDALKIPRKYERTAAFRENLSATHKVRQQEMASDPYYAAPWPKPDKSALKRLSAIVYGRPKESQSNPVSGHRYVSRATVGYAGCAARLCVEGA